MAKCIGTYPKWFAYCLKWLMARSKGYNVQLWFRGRGKRGKMTENGYRGNYYGQDLPLRQARRIAIYIKGV